MRKENDFSQNEMTIDEYRNQQVEHLPQGLAHDCGGQCPRLGGGRRERASEVKVSSFGYDSEDSTEFIQKALASGASTVIIDKQAGDWINWGLIGVEP